MLLVVEGQELRCWGPLVKAWNVVWARLGAVREAEMARRIAEMVLVD